MADVTATISISIANLHSMSIGSSYDISAQTEAGNDVLFDPLTKAISLNAPGRINLKLSGDSVARVMYFQAGIHYIHAVAAYSANTDTGLEAKGHGD